MERQQSRYLAEAEMDLRYTLQSISNHINSAKRGLKNFPRSGMNCKAITELDLVYNTLNDIINRCNRAMKSS